MRAHPWSSARSPAAGAGAGSVDEVGVVVVVDVVVVVVLWRIAVDGEDVDLPPTKEGRCTTIHENMELARWVATKKFHVP